MKYSASWILISVLVPVLAGCSGRADTSAELSPEQLGELGAKIYANGDQAPRILSETGISEAEFREQIEQVSTDPDKSRRYRSALAQNLGPGA